MDKMVFQIPGVIVRDKSLVGGARQYVIESQELLSPELLQRLISLENKVGWFTFSVEVIEADDILKLKDIPIDKSRYEDGKSPSQRLRAVLYRIHEKSIDPKKESFQQYYDRILEGLINKYKDILSEL